MNTDPQNLRRILKTMFITDQKKIKPNRNRTCQKHYLMQNKSVKRKNESDST